MLVENKNVLILGGAGFLGSNLAAKLISSGNHVTCLDNLHTGRLRNLRSLDRSNRLNIINGDIRNNFELQNDFDVIFNMACPASPPKYQLDEMYTLETSYIGTKNALEFAAKNDSIFVMASTSEIYGDPMISPQHETYRGNVNTIGRRACYDEGKRVAETLCSIWKRQYNLDARICRIFNTYGPNMDPLDGRVISNFINQFLEHKPITVYGDGKQTRSFCYVDELIDGIMHVGFSSYYDGPVNLGNDVEFTILELLDVMETLFHYQPLVHYGDLPEDDPLQRKPDLTKAKTLYKWQPKIALKQGLQYTSDYFKSYHANH